MTEVRFIARLLLAAMLVFGVAAPSWAAVSESPGAGTGALMDYAERSSDERLGVGADAAGDDRHSHDHFGTDHVHEAVVPDGSRAPVRPVLGMPRARFAADGLSPGPIEGWERPPRDRASA